ncbi:MAG: DNA polymerase III subunit alpha [Bacilli bacterium]
MEYAYLNIKSHYTFLRSLLSIEDIIEFSIDNNFSAVALCDKNSTYGLTELYFKAGRLKPLLGVELNFLNDSYILYAKNYDGLKNIFFLTTLVNKNELTYKTLFKNSRNLICILNESSKVYDSFCSYNDCTEFIDNLKNYFGEIFFISNYNNTSTNEFCLKFNLKKLYGNEIRYNGINNQKYYNLLCSIRNKEKYLRTERGIEYCGFKFDDFKHEMKAEYIENNKMLIAMCDIKIPSDKTVPIYSANYDSYDYLSSLCKKGLSIRVPNFDDKYVDRLKYELSIINNMGFLDYFLIVFDYVKYAKNNNIAVGPGRGSAAGSLVSYVLGITDIDPLKYNLIFERFLNPERISWPDIDVDFEDVKRDEVVKHVVKKYGEENVGAIATFVTFKSKQVIRDCAKAFGKNSADIKYFSEHLDSNLSLIDNYKKNDKFKMLVNSDVDNERIYKYALKLEGLIRHESVHPAGIVISSNNLSQTIGYIENGNVVTISSSMDYLERIGLIKMDFLGLRNLSILKSTVEIICENEGEVVDFNKINLDDKNVLKLFCEGNTLGIFQFESEGMKKLLRNLKPNSFNDLVVANALHRPGPMDNIDEYILRRNGKKFSYIHDDLKNILEETYGIIVYQEQIMEIARKIAGFSYAKADIMRSAMAKKNYEKLLYLKDDFIKSAVELGYDYNIVEEIYNLILKFADYGFNKAHSVSYSHIGFSLAYLKTYFFKYFMCVLLNSAISSNHKVFEYINECRRNNLNVIGIDINRSESNFCLKKNEVILPLTIVKGINEKLSNIIVEERKSGNYTSLKDFIVRTAKKGIRENVIENLIYACAFESIDFNYKSVQIHSISGIIDVVNSFPDYLENGLSDEMYFISRDEFKKSELVLNERKVLGFNFSTHPTSAYAELLEVNTLNISSNERRNVKMILYIESYREIKTKRGENMAFLNCSDMYGTIECVLFPKAYNSLNVEIGTLIYADGKVEVRNDNLQLIINNFKVKEE